MIKTAMEKVVIVGAGMTGAAVASLLRQNLPENVNLKIIDKSRGTGGRMATSRSSKSKSASVDLGAQYISITPEYASSHGSIHNELFKNNVLLPSTCLVEGDNSNPATKHYVAPKGIGSLVKYFLNKSCAEMSFNEIVTSVDVEDSKVKITTQEGNVEVCDSVILTMPVPQILQLQGSVQQIIDGSSELHSKLMEVSYSSRFALGLFYDPGTTFTYPWAAKYIQGNPCVRFVAIDNKKRGQDDGDEGPSIAVHTSVPFGLEHLERDKDEMKSIIMDHLKKVLPDLPDPVEVKGHKWRYSQVHKPFPGSPGCVVLCDRPLVILAGDGFSHSNMDGCLDSALAVNNIFLKLTGKL